MARQIQYGRQLGLPWGVSESAYAAQYPDGDYQYQAFGVPGLGLKQGLEKDHVIAPYATVSATKAQQDVVSLERLRAVPPVTADESV